MMRAIEARHYINGAYTAGSGATFDLFNPTTEQLVAKVSNASEEDVELAVASAQAALPAWTATSAAVKAGCLNKLAALIRLNFDTLGQLEAQSMGLPVSQYPIYGGVVAGALEHFAGKLSLFFSNRQHTLC